jgi:hypothetical protein
VSALCFHRRVRPWREPVDPKAPRQQVSQAEVSRYPKEHPGSWPAEIAEALDAPATNVSMHLNRGRHTSYERHQDAWYLRSSGGGRST